MKLFNYFRAAANQTGTAMIEMALIVPLVMLLGLGALDLSGSIGVHQSLSTLNREAASSAFRNCSELTAGTAACLSDVQAELTPHISSVVPGAEIIITIYRYNTFTNHVEQDAIHPTTGRTAGGYQTKYTAAYVESTFQSLNASNTIIVVSEIFYRRAPITKISFSSQDYYETTVF